MDFGTFFDGEIAQQERICLASFLQHGHTVTVANNGLEALHAFEEYAFDVILMDVQMPVMDGFESTQIGRAHV